MTELAALVSSLMTIAMSFVTAASGFLVPTYDTTAGTYNVTLIHIAIWVPVLLSLLGSAVGLVLSFFSRRKRKSA